MQLFGSDLMKILCWSSWHLNKMLSFPIDYDDAAVRGRRVYGWLMRLLAASKFRGITKQKYYFMQIVSLLRSHCRTVLTDGHRDLFAVWIEMQTVAISMKNSMKMAKHGKQPHPWGIVVSVRATDGAGGGDGTRLAVPIRRAQGRLLQPAGRRRQETLQPHTVPDFQTEYIRLSLKQQGGHSVWKQAVLLSH